MNELPQTTPDVSNDTANVTNSPLPPPSSSPTSNTDSTTTLPEKPSSTWPSFGRLGDLLTTVKKQSEIVVDIYRRDLTEFVQVVQSETKAGVRAAAQTVERNVEAVVGPLVEAGGVVTASQKSSDRVGEGDGTRGEEKIAEGGEEGGGGGGKGKSGDDDGRGDAPNGDEKKTTPTAGTSSPKAHRERGGGGGNASTSLFRKVAERTTAAVHSFDTAAEAFENAAVSKAGELVHAATGKDPRKLYDAATHGGGELVSKLGDLLSSAVTVVPPEEERVKPRRRIFYDRKEARLDELRTNPATYTTDPRATTTNNDPTLPDRFQDFLSRFRIPEQAGHISRLLAENSEINKILARLVPSEIPYDVFWQRYFFRVEELEREEERRRRIVQNVVTNDTETRDDFSWDMEDEDSPSSTTTTENPSDVSKTNESATTTSTTSPKVSDVDNHKDPTPLPDNVTPPPHTTIRLDDVGIEPPTEKISPTTTTSPDSSSSPSSTSSSSSPVILRSTDSMASWCPSRTSEEEGFETESAKKGNEKPDLPAPTPTPAAEDEDDWSDWE